MPSLLLWPSFGCVVADWWTNQRFIFGWMPPVKLSMNSSGTGKRICIVLLSDCIANLSQRWFNKSDNLWTLMHGRIFSLHGTNLMLLCGQQFLYCYRLFFNILGNLVPQGAIFCRIYVTYNKFHHDTTHFWVFFLYECCYIHRARWPIALSWIFISDCTTDYVAQRPSVLQRNDSDRFGDWLANMKALYV
jgi:hypothetical protein